MGRLVKAARSDEGYEVLVTQFQRGAPRWSPMSWADESWFRKAPKPAAAEPAFRLPSGAVAARGTSIRTSAAREVCGSSKAPVGRRVLRNRFVWVTAAKTFTGTDYGNLLE